MLPAYRSGDVKRSSERYSTDERYMNEGRGTVRGRPAVLKASNTAAADYVLNEVRAYERLADLQGQCVPPLEGAGTFGENGVFLAVSDGERAIRSELLRGQVDVLTLPAATSGRRWRVCGRFMTRGCRTAAHLASASSCAPPGAPRHMLCGQNLVPVASSLA